MADQLLSERFEKILAHYKITKGETAADLLHITPGHYSRLKNGKTPIKHSREALAEAFPDINLD